MLSRQAPRRGFTLVEFVVTLVVFGLLMAAVMPSIGAWMRSLRTRAIAESIQNGMQQARTEAMRRNARISFYLVTLADSRIMDNSCRVAGDGLSWVISVTDPTGKCGEEPSTTTAPQLVSSYAGGEGGESVLVSAVDNVGDESALVTFNGFGQVSNQTTAIRRIDLSMKDCNDCRSLRVEVSPNGAARMCDPNLSATGEDPRRCMVVEDN